MTDKDKAQDSILSDEMEIDAEGNKVIVQRALNANESIAHIPDEERTWNENESLSRGFSAEKKEVKADALEGLNNTSETYPKNPLIENEKI